MDSIKIGEMKKINKINIKFMEVSNMERPEIKAGMLVEYADGHKFLAIPDESGWIRGFGINCQCWATFADYANIIKIGYPEDYNSQEKTTFGKIIWEKSQDIVLTMDQIAEKFGVNVKNLKIQK